MDARAPPQARTSAPCANAELAGCNWLIAADGRPRALPLVPADPDAPERRGRAGPGGVPPRRAGQAPAAVRAARPRPAGGGGPPRVRPALQRRRAGQHRPRRRRGDARPRRGPRRRTASGGGVELARALPDAARPLPARDRPLLLADPGRGRSPPRSSATGSCSATSARTTARRSRATTSEGPPPDWVDSPRERVRDDALVGGLGGDLRPLPPHPRRAADGRRLRAGGRRARWTATTWARVADPSLMAVPALEPERESFDRGDRGPGCRSPTR